MRIGRRRSGKPAGPVLTTYPPAGEAKPSAFACLGVLMDVAAFCFQMTASSQRRSRCCCPGSNAVR